MESQVLFLPIVLMCDRNDSYKKIQKPIIVFEEHEKLFDKIKTTFGFKYIDKKTIIHPVMQLYNPTDFSERDIDLFFEVIGEDLAKEAKKMSKVLPLTLPITRIIYTSTGEHLSKEMQPIFKPLNEIPNVEGTLVNGDVPDGTAVMLFFLLPIIISHYTVKELDKVIEFILEYNIRVDNMDSLDNQINEYYKLTGKSRLSVFPICHTDFIGEEFDDIVEGFKANLNTEIKEPFVNENKINRNDDCPCGSGKKFKKCCIYQFN